jgi:N-acetylglucosaminyl-diphospho-decaprenol L-rhamnosyltransferase
MQLSICILTHSQPELLPKCVAACFAEIARAGITAEVIILDNASVDGSPERVGRLFPGAKVIRNNQSLGFSAANNLGIRRSEGRHVLILNDDAILQEGSLELMLRKLDSNHRIGAVGPRLFNPDGSIQVNFTNKRFPRVRAVLCDLMLFTPLLIHNRSTRVLLTDWKGAAPSGETEHVSGACLLARREALNAVGLFDEGFHFLYEDTDLCYRLKKAGWLIYYVAEANVIHYEGASFRKLLRSERSVARFRALTYYFRKHTGTWNNVLLRLMVAIILLLRLPMLMLYLIFSEGADRLELTDTMKAPFKALRVLLLEWG